MANLIAAAALEQPIVSATASQAADAITTFFLFIIMIASLPLVTLTDIFHRNIPIPDVVNFVTIVCPLVELIVTTYVRVTASNAKVATEPVTDSFEVIGCAVLAFLN
ncbi:hypothetical protein PIB30_113910, partial [Stylosanthes scabra]|nr:hypothetical protein [Stylosanthes scabra]